MRRSLTRLSRKLSHGAAAATGMGMLPNPRSAVQSIIITGLCSVCGDALGVEQCRTRCGHTFCRSCIEKIIRDAHGKCECPTCRKRIKYQDVQWGDNNLPIKDQEVYDIFDTTFIQFGTLGLESLHFTKNNCWLGYNPDAIPAKWKLDSGAKLPYKKFFERGWSYNAHTRTFRGIIDWGGDSFRGARKIKYEMIFDEEFELIVDGSITLYKTDGRNKTRPFGGDKLKNLFYRRVKTTVFGNSYVRVPSPEESEMADKIVGSLKELGAWGLGIPDSAVEAMLWAEMPLINLGVYSIHLSTKRSYLDISCVEGTDHPSRLYFSKAKYFPQTRTFKGDIEGDRRDVFPHRTQWILHFDETLDKIVWGKIKHFDQETGKLRKEDTLGWSDETSQRYLSVAPWQKMDDPQATNRFGALETLLLR